LGVRGSARREDLARAGPKPGEAVLAAYAANELAEAERAALLEQLLGAARARASVLVVEPIARRSSAWWEGWRKAFLAAGGREDAWRFRVPLPELLARFDRAAGLDHREQTAASLHLPGRPRSY
jgi:hypothetical protein